MAPRPIEVAEALRNKVIVAPAKWQDDAGVEWFTKHFMPRYPSTPRHPAWPSGHAVHGGVISTMLLALFEDGNPDVRAEAEKIELWLGFGRVVGGIHWLVDIEAGIEIGRQAADAYIKIHQL
jgi:membrane-associated phospholipid phosphatase